MSSPGCCVTRPLEVVQAIEDYNTQLVQQLFSIVCNTALPNLRMQNQITSEQSFFGTLQSLSQGEILDHRKIAFSL
jgi:hypothetical protein